MSTKKIYKLINLKNGKVYIGKTVKALEVRFSEHIKAAARWAKEDLENRPHPYQSRLYPSINKYGHNSFKIELVEEFLEEDITSLEEREKYWIQVFNSTDDTIGYNISPGGWGGPLFAGHRQSEHCKQVNSKRTKGILQDKEFIKKRSYARARLLQSVDTGEVISILDVPNGYFYKQNIIDYRLYKSSDKFYICLEQPHNRLPELTAPERNKLVTQLTELATKRHTNAIDALHIGYKNISEENRRLTFDKVSKAKQLQRKERLEKFMLDYHIIKEEYIQNYLKYKEICPNRHLELIYNISYSNIRDLNNYLGLFGGRSGHPGGKISIKENT